MPTWTTRPRRIWRDAAPAVAEPLSTHQLRDTALLLNVMRAYVARPVVINDQLQGAYAADSDPLVYAAQNGADPGTLIACWRSGCIVPPGMTRLRGRMYAARMAGDVGSHGTYAKFRIWSSALCPETVTNLVAPWAQSSAVYTYMTLDARAWTDVSVPLVAFERATGERWTWVAVTAWTDEPFIKQADESRAQLYGLELHASLEGAA